MTKPGFAAAGLLLLVVSNPSPSTAQGRPDPQAVMASQRQALTRMAAMDGVWRGTAWFLSPTGEKHTLTQTERVGPLLGGTIRVVEGRGYEADGTLTFNAFATISYSPEGDRYTLHSYAQGNVGDFLLTPSSDGFAWEIPAGPATIRYTALIKDGVWSETGDRIVPGKEPVRFFEMTLKRLADSDWPAAGALGPK